MYPFHLQCLFGEQELLAQAYMLLNNIPQSVIDNGKINQIITRDGDTYPNTFNVKIQTALNKNKNKNIKFEGIKVDALYLNPLNEAGEKKIRELSNSLSNL